MLKQESCGIVTAVVTPFGKDEAIDYGLWSNVIDYQIASGIDGLFPVGSGGEFYAMSTEERKEAAVFVLQAVNGRIPVYVQIGAVTTRDSIALALHAEDHGADFLVVITPYYMRPTADEMVRHFCEICSSVKLPVFAYNIPGRTGVELTPAIVGRIMESNSNFCGLKDSSGKIERIPDWLGLGLKVFMGSDQLIIPALELGCVGAVAACANVSPKLFVNIFRAFKNGNAEEAARLQQLAADLRLALRLSDAHPLIKEAMSLAGLPGGIARRPSGIASSEEMKGLHSIIEKLGANDLLPAQDLN
jgi:4-hydroxy-tetrahydrodipicolinate synthase